MDGFRANDDLPIDVRVIARTGGTRDDGRVLSREQLEGWGKVAPDRNGERWAYFDEFPDERRIAEWLRERGVIVRSVDEMRRRRPPDAVTTGRRSTPVEFKTLHPVDGVTFSHLTCIDNIRGVATKCRRGVIDARATNGSAEDAAAAIASALVEVGVNLDEIVVLIRDGRQCVAVGWRRE